MSQLRGIFIVAAKRTAFGTYGGKVKHLTATDLQEIAAKAALQQSGVATDKIDSVIVGNVMQSSNNAIVIARHVSIRCGIPLPATSLTVNRLCGSGFQSIVSGAQEIILGDARMTLCGGSENMTQAPFVLRDARFGVKFGTDLKLEDVLWAGLTDQKIKTPMGVTAENLAVKYKFSREDCDKYALQSQTRWREAEQGGRFKDEIVPIPVKGKKGEELFSKDEHPRAVTLEQLAKLPCVFKKNGTVTAGNASGICDGAAAVVLASEAAVKELSLKPLARLVGYHVVGCEPSIMGIGPVPAIRGLLKKNKLELKDIDLFDINEAFAPQFLSVSKELGLDNNKTNVNGGAIALGHPLGASGTRITANLVYELRRRNGRYAVGSACIGGGQGIAVLLERV